MLKFSDNMKQYFDSHDLSEEDAQQIAQQISSEYPFLEAKAWTYHCSDNKVMEPVAELEGKHFVFLTFKGGSLKNKEEYEELRRNLKGDNA